MRSDHYSWSRDRKPAHFTQNWPFHYTHLSKINQIANLNAGGEIAHNSAQSTYWSCHSRIRTHILNCSQSRWNSKIWNRWPVQTWQNTGCSMSGPVNNPPRQKPVEFETGLDPNRTGPPVITPMAGGLPGPVAITTGWRDGSLSGWQLCSLYNPRPELHPLILAGDC